MPVQEQVITIYAGTNGYLDDLDVADVRRFENELLADVRARGAATLDAVKAGEYPEDDIKQLVEDFKSRFVPSVVAAE
jgi:F-type H+-transporting ATPase subunit alpha